jgi:hypothetical protein
MTPLNDFIERHITYRTCYIFVIISIFTPASVLLMLINFPEAMKRSIGILIGLIMFTLNFYIIAGYIKYSFLVNEQKFRKIMVIVIALFAMNLILNLVQAVSHFKALNMIYLSPTYLTYLLLFYGFGLIRNADSVFFRRLSKLNLYSFILAVLAAVGMGLSAITKSEVWFGLVIPIRLAGFCVMVLLIYWQFKLFRYLHFQYEKIAETVN